MLRPAVPEDATKLTALMKAAYATAVARLGAALPVGGDYGEDIARYSVWIGECNGEMVGALVLGPQQDHMLLANVAVSPAHQRRGFGRVLLNKAESEARRQGFSEMRLFTHAGLTDTIALYERRGWVQLPVAQGSVRVAMIKRLD